LRRAARRTSLLSKSTSWAAGRFGEVGYDVLPSIQKKKSGRKFAE